MEGKTKIQKRTEQGDNEQLALTEAGICLMEIQVSPILHVFIEKEETAKAVFLYSAGLSLLLSIMSKKPDL